MRILGRLLLLSLLLGGVVLVARLPWQVPLPKGRSAMPSDDRLVLATPAIAYPLPREGWLDFPLEPGGDPLLKVVTNAEFMQRPEPEEDTTWDYAIGYQLVDDSGRVVEERDYHHRTTLTRYHRQGREYDPAFYLADPAVPADGRVMVLNLADNAAARLRLRIATMASAFRGVVARVYQRQTLPDYKLAHRWSRVSRERQARLSRGNVYGPELLSRRERLALLRHRWQPLAPAGTVGDDYRARTLYLLRDEEVRRVVDPVIPEGLVVTPELHGMIPVPPGGGVLSLRFESLAGTPPETGTSVALTWYGEERKERWTKRVVVHRGTTRWERPLEEGGVLDLVVSQPLVVRAFWNGELEITPGFRYRRSFLVAPGRAVMFAVEHAGGLPTPVRIDTRIIRQRELPWQGKAVLEYELLDAAGAVIHEDRYPLELSPSSYDQLLGARGDSHRVSEPARFYLNLPLEAGRIRFRSRRPLLVAVQTRPADLARELRVPEDYLSYDPQRQRKPGWFPVRPVGYRELLLEDRLVRLRVQSRPPRDNVEILAGNYHWEGFHPLGDWKGRYLFNPRDSRLPMTDEALAVAYVALAAGRDTELEFVATDGTGQVRPSLLYFGMGEDPVEVTVVMDGERLLKAPIRGPRGELRLPPFGEGRHRFRIEAPGPGRWYVNRVRSNGRVHLRRLANRIGGRPATFPYRKVYPEEVLIGHLQVPAGRRQRVRLELEIRALQPVSARPLAAWTFRRRRFDILPDWRATVPVLNTRRLSVDLGRRFFVPLLSDLPPGEYAIRVEVGELKDAYLTLYRLTPGRHERRRLTRLRRLTTVAIGHED